MDILFFSFRYKEKESAALSESHSPWENLSWKTRTKEENVGIYTLHNQAKFINILSHATMMQLILHHFDPNFLPKVLPTHLWVWPAPPNNFPSMKASIFFLPYRKTRNVIKSRFNFTKKTQFKKILRKDNNIKPEIERQIFQYTNNRCCCFNPEKEIFQKMTFKKENCGRAWPILPQKLNLKCLFLIAILPVLGLLLGAFRKGCQLIYIFYWSLCRTPVSEILRVWAPHRDWKLLLSGAFYGRGQEWF